MHETPFDPLLAMIAMGAWLLAIAAYVRSRPLGVLIGLGACALSVYAVVAVLGWP